jgi:hypothetical protein
MADGPISAVETVAFLAVMLFIVKLVIDALEAAPIGFSTQADDVLEDGYDEVSDVWTGGA